MGRSTKKVENHWSSQIVVGSVELINNSGADDRRRALNLNRTTATVIVNFFPNANNARLCRIM